jgi:TonB family protein
MKDFAGGHYAAAGTRLALLRARDRSYSLNVRLAIIVVLTLLITMFLLIKTPEVKPLRIEVPSDVVILEPPGKEVDYYVPKPPEDDKPEPADNVLTPGGDPVPAGGVDSVPAYVPNPLVTGIDTVIYDVKGVDVKPKVLESCKPEYPEKARLYGFEGNVMVKVLVDKKGGIEAAEVMESSDCNLLDKAALDCAVKWRFRPAYQNSRAVRVWVSIPFTFRLN